MIFFSDDIKNKIIDNAPVEEIVDNLEQFKVDEEMIFTYFRFM